MHSRGQGVALRLVAVADQYNARHVARRKVARRCFDRGSDIGAVAEALLLLLVCQFFGRSNLDFLRFGFVVRFVSVGFFLFCGEFLLYLAGGRGERQKSNAIVADGFFCSREYFVQFLTSVVADTRTLVDQENEVLFVSFL